MAKTRTKIPTKIEEDVMFKSRHKCYCGKRGDQIHHIDENPSNNDFDNLILLCYDHHHDASVKNGLKKKLSISELKKFRNNLYRRNEMKERMELKHFGKTLKKITDENLFQAALDAAIVMEIIKIKSEFDAAYYNGRDWVKNENIISKLSIYSEYKSFKVSYEVVSFLEHASDYARAGMPSDFSGMITHIAREYFPYSHNVKDRRIISRIAKICCNIAFAIIYDAFIYLGNLAVAASGFQLLKFLYIQGKNLKIQSIVKDVLDKYDEIEGQLKRPERNDLGNARRFLHEYKNDLERGSLTYPHMADDLFNLMQKHRNKANQIKYPSSPFEEIKEN